MLQGGMYQVRCIRSGGANHKAWECKNEPFCPTCNSEGHRVDRMKCPYFRNFIDEARKSRRITNLGK